MNRRSKKLKHVVIWEDWSQEKQQAATREQAITPIPLETRKQPIFREQLANPREQRGHMEHTTPPRESGAHTLPPPREQCPPKKNKQLKLCDFKLAPERKP